VLLRNAGYSADDAPDGRVATEMLKSDRYDLLLLDLKMPGIDGLQIVEALRIWGMTLPVLMISGFGTVDLAVQSLHRGADDFMTKPVEPSALLTRVSELLARRPHADGESAVAGLVGRSAAMREVGTLIAGVAPTDTTVLITGVTGAGKEVVARAVHQLSPRHNGAWQTVNCGALADSLLESELFGHVRGAFTGATRDREGLIEAADRGTLFLDEVGEMSLALQQRLLRVLQEREVTRLGSTRPRAVDIRVIAATNRNLQDAVSSGRFREDLYYRVAVFSIALPPLRQRRDDIPLLVEHGLSRLRERVPSWSELTCSPMALRALREYDWPGNVRHLFGVIESSAVRAGGGRIDLPHLPLEVREVLDGLPMPRYRAADTDAEERERIRWALQQSEGSLARAADLLGMGRTTLWRKMKGLSVDG
jgi:DNA-binding NtrC family response regulator